MKANWIDVALIVFAIAWLCGSVYIAVHFIVKYW
jgi:hypothetical protein